MNPRISVVIPTYNRATHLRRTLEALAEQDLAPHEFEVIVTDDGSKDGTPFVLAGAFPYRLVALKQQNSGPAAARNAAVRAASADIILFIDDDVIPARDLLSRHLRLQDQAPGVVIGRMAHPTNLRLTVWAEWETRMLEKQYADMVAGRWAPTYRQFYTANASVPRQVLLDAGLFDEQFRRAEDVELAYRLSRAALTFRFDAGAVVEHDTPRSLGAWMSMASLYGRYDVIMTRDKGYALMLELVGTEFTQQRRPALRAAARLLVGRGAAMAALRAFAPLAMRAFAAVGFRNGAMAVCSATFNLLYWDGVARELGARSAFWDLVRRWSTDLPALGEAEAEA